MATLPNRRAVCLTPLTNAYRISSGISIDHVTVTCWLMTGDEWFVGVVIESQLNITSPSTPPLSTSGLYCHTVSYRLTCCHRCLWTT